MSTILFDETFTEDGNNIDYRVQVAPHAWLDRIYEITISTESIGFVAPWSTVLSVHAPAPVDWLTGEIKDLINRKSPWLLRGSPHWQLCRRLADVIGPQRKPCDCGGARAGTTHSHWCSSRGRE